MFLVKKQNKTLFQKRFYQENVEATFLMLSRCHLGLTINHRAKTNLHSVQGLDRLVLSFLK